jgi:hypothetical protein
MSGVVERILSAEVSAEDLDRALTAVNSWSPKIMTTPQRVSPV